MILLIGRSIVSNYTSPNLPLQSRKQNQQVTIGNRQCQ
nr:MAG TPA: hypothetical protein [Caudoviricetes sp.]DAT60437.1 MAG TPA: hypothetical protein [Caudoviricetes sp.]DAX49669.1 MAG TPA: hypothetical protein [Caudoviricetes sp.]DAX61055.1 MAG TPA: hypothetical protein [Caudoviricetes sp.]